jgi:phosphoenolpyruvate---glycerone phosphotransferase subunit DhaL
MEQGLQRRIIEAVATTVIAQADELTHLDQQIGDGDHGLNMKRGFDAVLADIDNLAAKPLPEAVKAIGTMLVMKVGGASGPLYGTLFLALAKEIPADCEPTATATAFAGAIEAVKARGKSQAGQKTMLDVLVPAHDVLLADGADAGARLREAAGRAAVATVPMRAVRGRASFLGERSIGHMDPGARSSQLIIEAIVDALEDRT